MQKMFSTFSFVRSFNWQLIIENVINTFWKIGKQHSIVRLLFWIFIFNELIKLYIFSGSHKYTNTSSRICWRLKSWVEIKNCWIITEKVSYPPPPLFFFFWKHSVLIDRCSYSNNPKWQCHRTWWHITMFGDTDLLGKCCNRVCPRIRRHPKEYGASKCCIMVELLFYIVWKSHLFVCW